jgi:hypothetical protein
VLVAPAVLAGRALVLITGAARNCAMRSRSLAGFLEIFASGLSALTGAAAGAGAALRLATTLLRGSTRLGAARRGAAFALCVLFTLLVLDPGFLPGIAALLQVTGHLRTRDYTDA